MRIILRKAAAYASSDHAAPDGLLVTGGSYRIPPYAAANHDRFRTRLKIPAERTRAVHRLDAFRGFLEDGEHRIFYSCPVFPGLMVPIPTGPL